MDNKKRLQEIHSFLGELEFQNKTPDFIGAWGSKEPIENFNGMDISSYLLGFKQENNNYIVLDILGVSTMDSNLSKKGITIQQYDLEKCHISTNGESLRYWADKNVKKSGFDKRLPIIDQWDGNYITGEFDSPGVDPFGVFIIIKNDKGPLFQRLAQEISQKLALSLKLL